MAVGSLLVPMALGAVAAQSADGLRDPDLGTVLDCELVDEVERGEGGRAAAAATTAEGRGGGAEGAGEGGRVVAFQGKTGEGEVGAEEGEL